MNNISFIYQFKFNYQIKMKQKFNILVADDSLLMIEIINNILNKSLHNIIGTASNGIECLDIYTKMKDDIDLVVTDINMPKKDGLSCLKEIKAINQNQKVIVMSALSYSSIIEQALSYGADSYIIKPFNKELFLENIALVL